MKSYRHIIIFTVFLIFVSILLYLDPIPQDVEYHDFADQRKLFGIPNFWDVMSNLPMFFLGSYGLYISFTNYAKRPDFAAKQIPFVLCYGILLTCFGSAYYHWAPDNDTLVWDRLPMTLMFMPIFSLLIYDFVDRKLGQIAFYILVPLGIFSIFYWQYTESIGAGDLRPYVFIQFFPMVIAPFILWLYPKKTKYVRYIIFIIAWYIVAKICEYYDDAIFDLLGFWSGHTIKHLIGGISLFYVLKLIVAWEKELLDNVEPEA
ncbi:MAG: hypothetical protein HKO66_14220 [Saprospiraceae bacterium]|nr:hypothetical protein [Bacteroidia bacterium]NNE13834.1 hypothetical protein [Saprospiraceae bacterium]NNL93393.1 hypothetical protein [Saprospiraceae bacterium]